MAVYELVREIFNQCSGNQMRDVFIEEVEAPSPDEGMKPFLSGDNISVNRTEKSALSTIFDVDQCGTRQRYSWTLLD